MKSRLVLSCLICCVGAAFLYASDNKTEVSQPIASSYENNFISKKASYVGSKKCAQCHSDIYDEWSLSQHARMTRPIEEIDLKEKIPYEDLNIPKDQIHAVLGSHYVHRFVASQSGQLTVLPKIWDIREKKWLSSEQTGDEGANWIKECAGCHTTGFSPETETFVEAGIGCEACHGPGSIHAETRNSDFIVSSKSVSDSRLEMVCVSCHTSGMDNSCEYSFPAGYKPGDDINEYYSGLTPKPGQSPDNFTGDETYDDRLRQWNFLKPRLLLASGLTCDYCQNFRNVKTAGNSEYLTHNEYCMTCHGDKTDHPEEAPGTECIVCHKPDTHLNGKFSIHDHRFIFNK